jgi:hypothetical protein
MKVFRVQENFKTAHWTYVHAPDLDTAKELLEKGQGVTDLFEPIRDEYVNTLEETWESYQIKASE